MSEPEFSDLFEQYDGVYTALRTVLARSDGTAVDPAEVVREVLSSNPDIALSPAELLEQVVRAAAHVGVPIMVRKID